MGKWNSSPHPISDLRDWQTAGHLEVRPSFQRKEVWSAAAKIMLIDTILLDVPMPKMFLWNEIVGGSTHRRVIDGQQRILAILGFLNDDFALDAPYSGEHKGSRFSDLPPSIQEAILEYQIDFNEAKGFTEAEVREVYSRVNKYSLPLNRQELRRADYPGKFLDLSTEIAMDDYLDESRVFTVSQRRRMGDVEFVAELLAAMLEGPQDKKGDLDYFFERYAVWDDHHILITRGEFDAAMSDLRLIFPDEILALRSTRFRQKADFYTLFLAIIELRRSGGTLNGKEVGPLTRDMQILDRFIAPESPIDLLSEYAIKCVSQANSVSSRAWRRNLLLAVLEGTYRSRRPTGATLEMFADLHRQIRAEDGALLFDECIACRDDLKTHAGDFRAFDWPADAKTFQLANAGLRGDCPTNAS